MPLADPASYRRDRRRGSGLRPEPPIRLTTSHSALQTYLSNPGRPAPHLGRVVGRNENRPEGRQLPAPECRSQVSVFRFKFGTVYLYHPFNHLIADLTVFFHKRLQHRILSNHVQLRVVVFHLLA